MIKLIFATNNQHKVEEIQAAIGNVFEVITLKEAGIAKDIPEPYDTLEENATTKSKAIFELTGENCFGEDTGLEVFALNGEPGVRSARYAGDERSFGKNIDKLLDKLAGIEDRRARFRTIVSLVWEGKEFHFEGICEGVITKERKGIGGFGYDPVFLPSGSDLTFAEMTMHEKNNYSHRKKAADKLVVFLQKQVAKH